MGVNAPALLCILPTYVETVGIPGDTVLDEAGVLDRQGRRLFPDMAAPDSPPQFDALVVSAEGRESAEVCAAVRRLRLKIHRNGTLYVQLRAEAWPADACKQEFKELGLRFYLGWSFEGGIFTKWADGQRPETGMLLLRFHRSGYDPLAHARPYLREMGFGTALAILDDVPANWFPTEEERGLHQAERLLCLLAQDRHAGPRLRREHLIAALFAYTRTCTWIPTHVPPYICMAAFWKGVGREDLGWRLLKTVETILPSPEVERELLSYSSDPFPTATYVSPPFDPDRPPRILYLCHPESDYGSDLLYDGMRRILGPENVIEYPWKPTVHGQDFEKATGYPCTFHWSDGPRPLEELVRMAAEGAFDVILYSDTLGTLPKDDVQQILAAAPAVPLFVLDMWDECGDFLDIIRSVGGLGPVAGHFKREMIAGLDFGPNTWPLLFAYPDDRLVREPQWEGREGVFWAGKLIGGARRLTLSWVEIWTELSGGWGTPYTPEEYSAVLEKQLIGLSLFGNGFDTVRYWELPAHGVMLLSERSPLVIPHDFEDGKHAVFYDHAAELKEKLTHYLAHPEEAVAIAQAGHAHFLEYHTATARARQFLGQIQARLRELREGEGA